MKTPLIQVTSAIDAIRTEKLNKMQEQWSDKTSDVWQIYAAKYSGKRLIQLFSKVLQGELHFDV